jgi:urease accessory protein
MVIKEKLGNLTSFDVGERSIDRVTLEWYEVNKRILHKRSQSGREVFIKFMNAPQTFTQDDVLWCDEKFALVVVYIAVKPGSW